MAITYETASDLFLFLDPLSGCSGPLFSELLPELEGLPAVAVLLSPNSIASERCMSLLTVFEERVNFGNLWLQMMRINGQKLLLKFRQRKVTFGIASTHPAEVFPHIRGPARSDNQLDRVYRTTIISGTKGVKNGVKGCLKRHLLHRVDHVTMSRFFLACAVKCHEFYCPLPRPPSLSPLLQAQNITSPK
jgi:hypothetical protein